MSISSDEGKVKVVHVKDSTASSSKKAAKAKPDLSPEELKERKKENAKVAKTCKKLVDKLDPLLKTCNKACKGDFATQAFKDQVNGAKIILKAAKNIQDKCKDKTLEKLEFEHTEEVTTDLMNSLKKNLKCFETMSALVAGGMDTEDIQHLAEAAKQKKQKRDNSVDID